MIVLVLFRSTLSAEAPLGPAPRGGEWRLGRQRPRSWRRWTRRLRSGDAAALGTRGDSSQQHTKGYQSRWIKVKTARSGDCQDSQFWCTSKFWYPSGWLFGTQKGIKTDGFQNGKFWGLSKLAILLHQQFLVPVWVLSAGRTPKGSYSPRGHARHLLETPFSEPLLRTLLRTLSYCKTHSSPLLRALPRTLLSPEPSPEPSQNPS